MPKVDRVNAARARLDELSIRREQIIRAAELETCGLTRSTIYYRARPGGTWQRLLPGVIGLFNGSVSDRQRILAALRYTGSGAVITGVTALRLMGVRNLPDDLRVHLLIPQRRKRASRDFVLIQRTWRLPPHRWIERLPCAPVARAAVDAVREIRDIDRVRAILAEVVQRKMCGVEDLLVELAGCQPRGTALARIVMSEVSGGARSVAESKARILIAESTLPQPLWNYDLFDSEGHWLARPDAVWPELGVVLEIDSYEWHLSPATYRATLAKQRRLTRFGLTVLSVVPSDVRDDPTGVLDQIAGTLERAADRPVPVFTCRPHG